MYWMLYGWSLWSYVMLTWPTHDNMECWQCCHAGIMSYTLVTIFTMIKIINIYHQSLKIFATACYFWVFHNVFGIIVCHHHEEDMPAIIFQFEVPFITNQSITILSLLHLFIKLTNQPSHENEFEAWLGLFQVSQILKWSEKI